MTCLAHPWGLTTGLTCTRTDAHAVGHTFAASDAPDRHIEGDSETSGGVTS